MAGMRKSPFRHRAITGVLATGIVLAFAMPGAATAADPAITPTAEVVTPVAIPIQGPDRVTTAIEASRRFGTASSVVLATGRDFPDALGGSALAGAVRGPILLTGGDSIEAPVLIEIERLGATKVYILGGTGAVSARCESQLTAAGLSVERLAGSDRYSTAKVVADKTIQMLGDAYDGGAFIATGTGYADALAAAPLMYAQGMPLVLVDGAGALRLSTGMDTVDILGGTGVVPTSVEIALGARAGTRLAGANRYETAIAVARYGVSMGMQWDRLGIATGESFPDALCAGPLLGKNRSVLLMTRTAELPAQTGRLLGEIKEGVDAYHVFGGTAVVSPAVRASVASALQRVVEPLTGHDLPRVFCTDSGCHDTNLASIHIDGVSGGCVYCHDTAPLRDCESCHNGQRAPVGHASTHPALTSEGGEACTQSGCHTAGVVELHTACVSCHVTGVYVAAQTCEDCHAFAEQEHAGVAAHTVSGTCFGANCHGTDVTRMHAIDFRASGEEPPGCAACHNETVAPSVTCLGACHSSAGFAEWHDPAAGHAALTPAIETKSSGCVSCHGSDLLAVAPGEHAGCSCHARGDSAGADSCESCHVAPMDPLAPDPYHVDAHAAWEATARGEHSIRCVSCHGPQLVAIRPNFGFEYKEDHGGCVCHYYDTLFTDDYQPTGATTTDATECVSCHNGVFDPHGGAFISGG
ncbi:MAG: Glycoside hydrolase family 18 [Actinobacteria bacterium 66_15]|nr:MAG: Glycoside hydrolase family 18 [Actinobacteria bacterium 66_15]